MPAALVRSHPRASDEGIPYLFAHRAQDARPGIPETPSICVSSLALREEALEEWTRAETFSQVHSAWGAWESGSRSTVTGRSISGRWRGGVMHSGVTTSPLSVLWIAGTLITWTGGGVM